VLGEGRAEAERGEFRQGERDGHQFGLVALPQARAGLVAVDVAGDREAEVFERAEVAVDGLAADGVFRRQGQDAETVPAEEAEHEGHDADDLPVPPHWPPRCW
jgi:hypothetical protein